MSEKHIVVQGATLKCKFSVEPKTDKLKVDCGRGESARANAWRVGPSGSFRF